MLNVPTRIPAIFKNETNHLLSNSEIIFLNSLPLVLLAEKSLKVLIQFIPVFHTIEAVVILHCLWFTLKSVQASLTFRLESICDHIPMVSVCLISIMLCLGVQMEFR